MRTSYLFFGSLAVMMLYSISYAQLLHLEKYKHQTQQLHKVRIASASIIPEKWDKDTNWLRIEKMVRKAVVEGGANVVVTPEGVLEGYVVMEVNREEDPVKKREMIQAFFQLGEPLDGPYIQKARDLADELNVYFVDQYRLRFTLCNSN